jgi:hypothetical protein
MTAEEVSKMTHAQLISQLRAIANAAMNPDGAPPSLDSYDKRSGTARLIGEELNKRGGFSAMKDALERDLGWIPGCRTIEGFWNGIGSWLG